MLVSTDKGFGFLIAEKTLDWKNCDGYKEKKERRESHATRALLTLVNLMIFGLISC